MTSPSGPQTVAVAICTYNRNEPLTVLLNAVRVNAANMAGKAAVGVVVVDDSSDGKAREVTDKFDGCFELGIKYCFSGRQNISLARNMAIENASDMGDWTVMVDDDCEPVPEWLGELLAVQARTGADAVTGPMMRRVPPGSPKWLTDEPFLELGHARPQDEAELTIASTFNSMISSRWIREHPMVRFQPALGRIGGEDMVFYRAAHAEGLRIRYAKRACVYENEPASRANFAYQLRLFYWHGNSSYVTTVSNGVRPFRVFLHGVNSLRQALMRPMVRLCRGERPQLRYCLATVLHALGKIVGAFGIRVRHR